jgi:PGF-pre-PGF domain-containing protein
MVVLRGTIVMIRKKNKKEKYFRFLTSVLLTLLLFGMMAGGAEAATPISSCGTTISAPGEYVLTTSISNSVLSSCIIITSGNVTFDGAGYTIDGVYTYPSYGVYVYNSSTSLTNITVTNLTVTNWYYGIYYKNVLNGNITNNTANSNPWYGIYLYSSSYINISNNTAGSNNNGIYLEGGNNYNTLTNNNASSNYGYGIYLSSSNNFNTLTNNTANSNSYYGIYLGSSNFNTLTSNTANSNSYYGIYLSSSSSNNITNNIAKENTRYDIYIDASSDSYCNNVIANTTGSGDRNILFYNATTTLKDETFSELILCNADNSSINNVTIDSSLTKRNNMLYVHRTDNSNFTNINSSDSYNGIYLSSSFNNTITNNILNSNIDSGIYLLSSGNNTITNNTVEENDVFDVNIYASSDAYCNNVIENITGSGDRLIKYLNRSDNLQDETFSELIMCNANNSNINNVTIDGSQIKKNNVLYVHRTYNSNFTNINSMNNYYGIYLYNSNSNNLTNNNISNNSQYGIYLSSSSSNNVTNNNASNNSQHGIYLYYSNNNTFANNIANNNNQNGIYLYPYSNYNTFTDNIASSNKNSGFYLYQYSNYNTLINNTARTNSQYGIQLSYSSSNNLTNNDANSNNYHGIYILSSSSNNVANNNASNNNQYGINLYSSSNNILINNNASSNSNYGIYLYSSSSNNLTNNTAKENNFYDIYIDASSDSYCNNVIVNTTGSGERQIKYFNTSVNLHNEILSELFLCNADNSSITNVTIDGSPSKKNNVFYLLRSDNSSFMNINSSNNYYGIYVSSSSNNTYTDTMLSSNYYGMYLSSSSNNTLTNITANFNGYGIYFISASNNTLANNSVSSNTNYGIYLVSAGNNTIYNNYFNNNNNFGFSGTAYNQWNTTRTPGMNIVRGSNLGGNYWARPSGTGFSQICNDGDYNWICDSNYTLNSNNIDYLPLYSDTMPPNAPAITVPSNGTTLNIISTWVNGTKSADTTNVTVYVKGSITNNSVPVTGTTFNISDVPLGTDDIYQINVSAKDAYGNVNATNATVIVTVDTIPPDVPAITVPANGATLNTAYTWVNGTKSADTTNVTVYVNGSNTNNSVPVTGTTFNISDVPLGADGIYQINVSAKDAAGNVNTTNATVTIAVDTAAPVWSPIPSDQIVELGANFSYDVNATDLQTITYSVNDTANFKMDGSNGTITNNVSLSPGNYYLNITATDASSNQVFRAITITVQSSAQSVSRNGDSGGGSGGQGVVSSEPFENIARYEMRTNQLIAGASIAYHFTSPDLIIYQVTVIGRENTNDVAIRVEILKDRSTRIQVPAPGTVYRYANIFIGTNRIKGASIDFKLENKWLEDNKFTSGEINLVNWNGNEWILLDIKEIGNDGQFSHFEAQTESFSGFAITGIKAATDTTAVSPAATITGGQVGPTTSPNASATKKASSGGIWLAIAAICTIVYLLRRKK